MRSINPASRYSLPPDRPGVMSASGIESVLPPSPLYGANGIRLDDAGELHVAQAFGSQISKINLETGAVTTVAPVGGDILAPDDLAFDSQGVLYATEVFSERVTARSADGSVRVVSDGLPVVNGIVIHQDRIFVDEFRLDGRILELYADGRAPRIIAQNLLLPNALCVGPDGYLYFPLVVSGEIARVLATGGAVETFAAGLNLPTAVKFDPRGRLVAVESGSGRITRFDLQSRAATEIGRVRPGIDNLEISAVGDLYVSNFSDGGISHILASGAEETVVGRGLLGPFGIAVCPDGRVCIADGMSYGLLARTGELQRPSMLLTHGFPGYVRGVAVGADSTLYFGNSAGGVASFAPGAEARYLATGLDEVMGLAVGADGDVIACEAGAGRLLSIGARGVTVLASGLKRPTGIAVGADGACYVSEAAAGRVVRYLNGAVSTLASGLQEPHGVALSGTAIYVVDRGAKALYRVAAETSDVELVAEHLPLGHTDGIVARQLPGIPGIMPGPLLAFSDLATDLDGSILIAGDGDGSLLRFRPTTTHKSA